MARMSRHAVAVAVVGGVAPEPRCLEKCHLIACPRGRSEQIAPQR